MQILDNPYATKSHSRSVASVANSTIQLKQLGPQGLQIFADSLDITQNQNKGEHRLTLIKLSDRRTAGCKSDIYDLCKKLSAGK